MESTIDLSNHGNLSQIVYRELLREIMGGVWKPRAQISVRTQAERFRISVTPVRDALLKLAGENILLSERRSFRIPSLSKEEFAETRVIRVALERILSLRAAEVATPELAAELRTIHAGLAAAKRAGDYQAVMELNRRFHFTLYDLAGMPHAVAIVKTLWAKTGPYQHSLYLRDVDPPEEEHDHLRVLEGLATGDHDLVAAAIVDDITLRSVKFEQAGS